jgi:hypothetical protein
LGCGARPDRLHVLSVAESGVDDPLSGGRTGRVNETRLAVLGIVVTIGLTVGIGFDATWWIGVLAGGGSFLLSCFVIRFRPARRQLMSFTHWLTGS